MQVTLEVSNIGQALAAERAISGQRAYIIAARAGVHPSVLSKIEKGERLCSLELAARVRAAIAAGHSQQSGTEGIAS